MSALKKFEGTMGVIGIIVMAFSAGWLVGHGMKPEPEVKIVQKVDEVEMSRRLAEATRLLEEKYAQKIAERKNKVTKKRVEKLPDGTVIAEIEIKDTGTVDTDTTKDTRIVEMEREFAERVRLLKEELKVDVKPVRPDWAYSLSVGLDRPSLLSIPDPKQIVVGGSVSRRVFGDLFLGLWANTHSSNPGHVIGGLSATLMK